MIGAVLLLVGALPGAATGASSTSSTDTTAPSTSTDTSTTTEATTTTVATTASTEATTTSEVTTTTASTTTTEASSTSSTDTTAGSGGTGADPDADKARIEAAESAKAAEINAANARLEDLSSALADAEAEVEAQAAALEIANRDLATAQAIVDATAEEVSSLEARVRELEYGMSDQAIRSFKGGADNVPLLVGDDPNEALRMQAMLAKATQSDIDYANLLESVKEDLVLRRREAEAAADDAQASRELSEQELSELQSDQQEQRDLAYAAESRLDHLLSERAALAQLGAEVDAGLEVDIDDALVARLAAAQTPPSSSTVTPPDTVSDGEIVSAGNGIMVHQDIVADVRRLLAAAAADGIVLAGGGYRDPAGQIAVRRNNCGTSNYAIYEMPSSQCRPPTARPGRSMHEQGRAIDFTQNGRILTRSSSAYAWLVANAATFGLYNLPSEAWHWSTNGR